MNARIAMMVIAAGAALAGGCAGGNLRPAGARVDVIDMHVMPVALNWNDRPGPDGIKAQVFLFSQAQPAPLEATGAIEFLLYEGTLNRTELAAAKPIHLWRFDPADLKTHVLKTLAGEAYMFALDWGLDVPRTPTVTLVARYERPDGTLLWSAPTVVNVTAA